MNVATLKNRFRMLPNQRTITHVVGQAGASQTIAGCVRRPWSMKEIQLFANGAGLDTERAAFLLPTVNISGAIPANGDKLTDNENIAWTILAVSRELEGAMIRCTCIKRA